MKIVGGQGATRLVAYRGDARTLLAFDLLTEASHANLAGFTIRSRRPVGPPTTCRTICASKPLAITPRILGSRRSPPSTRPFTNSAGSTFRDQCIKVSTRPSANTPTR